MLDRNYHRTEEVEEMRFGAILTEVGYNTAYSLKAYGNLIKHPVTIICNPGSPEEAIKINSALKTLCLKINKNTGQFYGLLIEGLHRRMIFRKLSQVYAPLNEELKVNKEFIIVMIKNKLMSMENLQELSGDPIKISHYIIHNINNYRRLKTFLYICQNWIRDRNLIEELEEIVFEIELFQCSEIKEKIKEDRQKKLCKIY